jgi:hypothetical protein
MRDVEELFGEQLCNWLARESTWSGLLSEEEIMKKTRPVTQQSKSN